MKKIQYTHVIKSAGGEGREVGRTTSNQVGARIGMTPLKIWRKSHSKHSNLRVLSRFFCFLGMRKRRSGRAAVVMVTVVIRPFSRGFVVCQGCSVDAGGVAGPPCGRHAEAQCS